jgi:hypothetical protein
MDASPLGSLSLPGAVAARHQATSRIAVRFDAAGRRFIVWMPLQPGSLIEKYRWACRRPQPSNPTGRARKQGTGVKSVFHEDQHVGGKR